MKTNAYILFYTKEKTILVKDTFKRKKKANIDWLELKKLKRVVQTIPSHFYLTDNKGNLYLFLNTVDFVYFFPCQFSIPQTKEAFVFESSRKLSKLTFLKTLPLVRRFTKTKRINIYVIEDGIIYKHKAYYFTNEDKIVFANYELDIKKLKDFAVYEGKNLTFFFLKKDNTLLPIKFEFQKLEREENFAEAYSEVKKDLFSASETIMTIEEMYKGEKGFFEKYGNFIIIAVIGIILIMGLVIVGGQIQDMLKITKDIYASAEKIYSIVQQNQTIALKPLS